MNEKHRISIYILLASINLLVPMLVSFLSYVLIGTSTFNPFWGVGLGLGYEAMAGITGSIRNSGSMIVGGVLWPLLFFAAVTLAEGSLLIKKRGRMAGYLWAGFIAITLVNFPVSDNEGSLYQRLPLYSKTQSFAY